jgi:hypothetical protein
MITRMQAMTVFSLLLLAGLNGCSTTPDATAYPVGSLHLHERLLIEPDAATARLQYGRVVARNAVQEQDPFCVFEIDTVRPDAQVVQPGEFAITSISRSVETIAGLPVFPPFSSFRPTMRVSFGDDDSPSHIYYKTTFRLRDAQQPVRALTCMSNQNAPGNANFMRHLTMAEIRGALGTRFTLHLAR